MNCNSASEECPLLSILVLTYNQEQYIEACLRGLLALDYPNLELFVLDDGSNDDTFAISESALKKASFPARAITQPQSGGRISESSRRLLGMASGKYVLLMAGDDMISPSFDLKRTVSALELDPDLTIVFARGLNVTERCADASTNYSNELEELLLEGDPTKIYREHLCKQVSRLFLQGAVIRESFVREFGGFDETLTADDYAFMVRAFRAMQGTKKKVQFNRENIWLYRVTPQGIHRNLSRQRRLIMEVVSKYIPSECWASFKFDHWDSDDYSDFQVFCKELRQYFGPVADEYLIPRVARHFVAGLIGRKRKFELMSFLFSGRAGLGAWMTAASRIHKLLR